MKYPRLDASQARHLLAALFAQAPGVIEHRWMLLSGGMLSEFFPSVKILLQSMSSWPIKAHHFFGVATRRDGSSGRKENLLHLVTLHADIDHGQNRHYQTRKDALAAIEAFPLRPSAVVDTSNGFHCYWFFFEPLAVDGNLIKVEEVNKGIGRILKGDPVGDASRVLRIPGTWNIKNPANPKSVNVLWCEPERRYSLKDFAEYMAHPSKADTHRTPPRLVNYGSIGGTAYGRAALADELGRLAQMRKGSHCRNIQLNRAAFNLGRLVGSGHIDRIIVELHLAQVGLNIGLPEREVLATLNSGLNAGIQNPRLP